MNNYYEIYRRISRRGRRDGFMQSVAILLAGLILVSSLACADRRKTSEERILRRYPDAAGLTAVASYMAGMDPGSASPLRDFVVTPAYAAWCGQVEKDWAVFEEKKLRIIAAWRGGRVPSAVKVFYPFSGPDIVNALAFFPEATEFVMIGLEEPGVVPDPLSAGKERAVTELWDLRMSLRTLLMLNFFRTAEMKSDFKTGIYDGVVPVMMFLLARMGCQVLAVEPVTVDREGSEVKGAAGDTQGVRIVFRRGPGEPVVTARYFRADLSDNALAPMKGFTGYMGRYAGNVTFLKSASYLLGYDYFTTMRSMILGKSAVVVQDDAGIPYKYFAPADWDLKLYGRYRVLEMFRANHQPDLQAAMKERSLGPLPFSYGYGFAPERSHMMIAVRRR